MKTSSAHEKRVRSIFHPSRLLRGGLRRLSRLPVINPIWLSLKDKFSKPVTGHYFVCNATAWKHVFLEKLLLQMGAEGVHFVDRNSNISTIRAQFIGHRDAIIIIWGTVEPAALLSLAQKRSFPIWRMEDGFIRSRGLGAHHIPPRSLIFDRSDSFYFMAEKASEMETYLATHNFSSQERETARQMIDKIIEHRLTKYNLRESTPPPIKNQEGQNILVFGQCEDDQSIIFGSPKIKLNTDLLEQVMADFPEADIYFRPHPDVTAGLRPRLSDERTLGDKITILDGPLDIWGHLDSFNSVCVLTSLAGFEALLRGKTVHTYGLPFYAGWNLTEDWLTCERRGRSLQLEDAFYAAYIAAPVYFDPETGAQQSLEQTIDYLKTSSH